MGCYEKEITHNPLGCYFGLCVGFRFPLQAQVRSALGRLIAVSESYPDLKANQNFLELQAQLEGTENRISVARKEFNEVAKTYNVAVRRFPANLVAKLFGFGQKPYFEAAEGTETAPRVQF